MIVHMCKLQIVVLDQHFERVLGGLKDLGYLHLETVQLGASQEKDVLHRMQLSEEDQNRRRVLAEAKRIIDELVTVVGKSPEPNPEEVSELKAQKAEEILDLATEMQRKIRALRRRWKNLMQDKNILERYMSVGRQIHQVNFFGEDADVLMFTFPTEERIVTKDLQENLRSMDITSLSVRFFRTDEGKSMAVVACPKNRTSEVRQKAWESGTLEFRLPRAYRADSLTKSFKRIQADLDSIPDRINRLNNEFDHFVQRVGHYAAALKFLCNEQIQMLDARDHFIEGSYVRVLHVWVPVDKKAEVLEGAAKLSEDRMLVEELPIGPRLEEVPVVLKNPRFAKPFEVLLKIFSPPTYGTFDPTVVNAIGVPFFFGLIVGDIAYGLVILALALWLRQRFRDRETIHSVATIGIYCAIATVIFGFLYGEMFGSLGVHLGMNPVIHRDDPQDILLLMKIAVCIGAAHVALGLVFGIINAHAFIDRHTLKERTGQLLCLISVALAAAWVLTGSHLAFVVATASFFVGIATLIWGAGMVGLLEVFSLFSNILSYMRLMALGVASVVLALVANHFFKRLDYGLTGLFVAMLFHGLNILIAMFSPTIHTLRLHYVEFFSKFYCPGGKSYVPFGNQAETSQ